MIDPGTPQDAAEYIRDADTRIGMLIIQAEYAKYAARNTPEHNELLKERAIRIMQLPDYLGISGLQLLTRAERINILTRAGRAHKLLESIGDPDTFPASQITAIYSEDDGGLTVLSEIAQRLEEVAAVADRSSSNNPEPSLDGLVQSIFDKVMLTPAYAEMPEEIRGRITAIVNAVEYVVKSLEERGYLTPDNLQNLMQQIMRLGAGR